MGNYEQELARLNQAQRLAVTTTDGPVLVIAGPGTGKTQLLAVRIGHILQTTDSLPQNILCLTFTDSAVHTMRQRLASLIGQPAYDVTISTYHSFGSELIRRFPEFFSNDMPDARPIDQLESDQILRDIIKGLPYSSPLKFADSYINNLKTLLSDFKKSLLTPEDVQAVAKSNDQFIKQANPLVQQSLKGVDRISKASFDAFQQLASATKELAAQKSVVIKHSEIKPLAAMWQEELAAALEEASITGSTKPLTAWKNRWLARDNKVQFIVNGARISEKLRAAAAIYRKYLDVLQKRHLFDYDDMILRAIDGLQNNPDLKYSLQEQYLYLMLDEFQDTNAAQLRLIRLLTDSPVNEGRPNVLAVGDDDQAIYAFQGADYSNMLAFQKAYQQVLLVPLTQNYRSHEQILDLAQGVVEQITERLHNHLPGVQKTLTASANKLPKEATIERHEFKSDVAQFAWVAQTIKKLTGGGMTANQIAILAPQHRYLEPLVPYLQQAGIKVRYEKRENVLEQPLIRQLIQMIKLVIALGKQDFETADFLWPEILSYEFWGLKTDQIWQLSWQAYQQHDGWTPNIMEHAVFKQIGQFMVGLGLALPTIDLETLFDYLIGSQPLGSYASPLYDYYFGVQKQQSSQFWTVLSDLTVLRQHLRDYRPSDDRPLTADNFIAFVEAHLEADIKILNTSPYHEDGEAVELMTAFKAKGQEFEAVFVVACLDEVWTSRANVNGNQLPLPANLQPIRYGGASEDERLRLFYVALTRAKTQLYLTSYTNNFANKPTSRLRYLDETESDGRLVSPLLPAGRQVVNQDDSSPPAAHELTAYWQQRHEQAQITSLKALLTPRLDRFQLSASHLNSFTDPIYAGPQSFFMNTLLHFPSASSPEGKYGTAVHRTLEKVHVHQVQHNQLPSDSQLKKMFQAQLILQRLDRQHYQQLLLRGQDNLVKYLKQRGQDFHQSDQAEVNFRQQGVFVGKAHLGGIIDKLVIDKAKKQIVIVDYKTGKSHRRWLNSDATLYKYRRQLYFYKMLVEGSHSFADYTVKGAVLSFVEADDAGQCHDLHLEFNEVEMDQIKKLISAVWQHIMELNFPSISDYTADNKGLHQLEQALINGDI